MKRMCIIIDDQNGIYDAGHFQEIDGVIFLEKFKMSG